MSLAVLFLLGLATAIGLLVVHLLWPEEAAPRTRLLRLGLGTGLGLGLTSLTYYGWLVAGGASRQGVMLILEGALLLLLAGGLLHRSLTGSAPAAPAAEGPPAEEDQLPWPKQRLRWAIPAGLGLLGLLGSLSFLFQSLWRQHGRWDAWMIWNLRARFLHRGGTDWQAAFHEQLYYSHPEYPLCVPASVARVWSLSGETVLAPVLVGLLFTLATLGVVVGGVTLLRGRTQALLAAIALLGTAFFLRHGASQYADVPLGFCIAASLTTLLLGERFPARRPRFLVLAGLCAALAAWTKNEGLLFLGVSSAACGGLAFLDAGWRQVPRRLGWFALGALPVLIVLIHFKAALAPASWMIAGQEGSGTFSRLGEGSRYGKTVLALLRDAVKLPLPFVLGYAALLGLRRDWRSQRTVLCLSGALGLVLVGYAFALITSPVAIEFQLDKAVHRLLLQLWPAFLLLTFLLVRTPREAQLLPDVALGEGGDD